jgi:hypothetical protein
MLDLYLSGYELSVALQINLAMLAASALWVVVMFENDLKSKGNKV